MLTRKELFERYNNLLHDKGVTKDQIICRIDVLNLKILESFEKIDLDLVFTTDKKLLIIKRNKI